MDLLAPQDTWLRAWHRDAWVNETTGELALSVLDFEPQNGDHWLPVEVRITIELDESGCELGD